MDVTSNARAKGRIRTGLKTGASLLALILFGVALPLITNAGGASAAGPCGPPVVSVIACENSLHFAPGRTPYLLLPVIPRR